MRVLGLSLAGVLSLIVPITGHADGPRSVLRPANARPAWYRVGMGRRRFGQTLGGCRRPSNGRSHSPME
jgi:hypothetical protein